MADPSDDWTGFSLAQGRYLVRDRLGQGGMAVVYRGLDRTLDCDVVIKVPRRSHREDPGFVSRFDREVRSLVALTHPSVVKVSDVGRYEGVPFAVLQYLEGGSLAERLAAQRKAGPTQPFPLDLWLPQVAAALDFVHSRGYLHRDVKPANILFDAHGHPYLSDFGLAKVIAGGESPHRDQTSYTAAGLVLGTPDYLAPELVMGQPFDGRADQYALAVTVYEAVAGRRPFQANSPSAVMVLHTTHPPPPLGQVAPGVALHLAEAVSRALSKDPGARFADCSSFVAAVAGRESRGGATSRAHSLPNGSHSTCPVTPDRTRVQCPGCGKGLVFATSALIEAARTKRPCVTCPRCGVQLTLNSDGTVARDGPPDAYELASGDLAETPVKSNLVQAPLSDRSSGQRKRRDECDDQPLESEGQELPGLWRHAFVFATGALVALGGALFLWKHQSGALAPRSSRENPPAVVSAPIAPRVSALPEPTLSVPTGELEMGSLELDMSGVPETAVIVVDGQQRSRHALRNALRVTPGIHSIAVAAEGFASYRRDVPVLARGSYAIHVDLLPLSRPERDPPLPSTGENSASLSSAVSPLTVRRSPLEPSVSPAEFETISGETVVEKAALSEVLTAPESFANMEVVPTGLYLFLKRARAQPDGTVLGFVCRVGYQARINDYAALRQQDAPRPLLMELDLAEQLRTCGVIQIAPYSSGVKEEFSARDFGDTAAVLTLHVQRRVGPLSNTWVPLLKEAEFVIGINFWRVGERKLKDSFRTLTITADGMVRRGPSPRTDWSVRLGTSYLTQLKNLVHNMKGVRFAQEYRQVNSAMAATMEKMAVVSRRGFDPAMLKYLGIVPIHRPAE